MEARGGREIPILPADDKRSSTWRHGDCARPAHRRVSGKPCGTGPHFQTFQRQDCFTGDSIMTMTYPFPVSGHEFRGKRVLVTGGTKGMGQAMVRRFTLSGASVATTARSPLRSGQAVALFVQTDIGTAAGVQAVISRIQQEWGGLDILVNNVGGSDAPNGGYKALSDDNWQKALNVNLLASVRLDRAFLPGMIERQSGVILSICAIHT